MNILQVVENMSEDMYLRLKHAAETGKWPEGTPVEPAQRDSALQLSMAYQARHLNSSEMLSVGSDGNLIHKTKRELKAEFTGKAPGKITPCNKDENDIARFKDI